MEFKVLVAYATKHGATKEIAVKIADTLGEAGLTADVLAVEVVKDLAPYNAVVLGSAVYVGQWRREAADFLETHVAALAERPVWIFSSGPTGEGDPVELLSGWQFPEGLQPLADKIAPRAVEVFSGELDTGELSLGEKLVVRGVKAPLGDYRDWDAIVGWAREIAETLKPRMEALRE